MMTCWSKCRPLNRSVSAAVIYAIMPVQPTFRVCTRTAQRKRVPKIPTDRTKNQLRLGLPPFEDRRPGRHSRIFNLQHRRLRKLQHSRRECLSCVQRDIEGEAPGYLAGCGKRGVDERSFLSQWPVQGY